MIERDIEECPKCCGTGIDELAVSCEGEPPVVCDVCDGKGECYYEDADYYRDEMCLDKPGDYDPWDVEHDYDR